MQATYLGGVQQGSISKHKRHCKKPQLDPFKLQCNCYKRMHRGHRCYDCMSLITLSNTAATCGGLLAKPRRFTGGRTSILELL